MKQTTELYIENKYRNYKKIFTDASKQGEKLGIGIFEEDNNIKLNYRLNDGLSITTGELVAIKKVLENKMHQNIENKEPFVICTDSLGACKALLSKNIKNKARPDIIVDILNLNDSLKSKGYDIRIVWIPSHVDITGNDIADELANEGRMKEEIEIDIKLGYSEIKQIVDREINEKVYQKQYEVNQNYYVRKFRKIFPSVSNRIIIDKDHVMLNRLRARACKINQFNEDIYCRICKVKLDYKHALKNCTKFDKERSEVERNLLRNKLKLNITNILSSKLDNDTNKSILILIKKINSIFPV